MMCHNIRTALALSVVLKKIILMEISFNLKHLAEVLGTLSAHQAKEPPS
jgi:hypothetical protein